MTDFKLNGEKVNNKIFDKDKIFNKIAGKKLKTLLYSNQYDVITVDELLEQAAKLEPSNFSVWYAWGIIKKFQNDLIEAEQKLQKALEIDPTNIQTKIEIARVVSLRGNHFEAKQIFLEILSNSILTQKEKIGTLEYISDNYISWGNREFQKKNYIKWNTYTQEALKYIKEFLIVVPSNNRIKELQREIFLSYGLRLYQRGRTDEGKKFLLKIIKEENIKENKESRERERIGIACFYLADYEFKRSGKVIEEIEHLFKKGLRHASGKKIMEPLRKLEKKIKTIKSRRFGQIVHYDSKKHYGIIESKNFTCVFFPSCLELFCKDLNSLTDRKVSFIPIRDAGGLLATQIRLVDDV